MESTWNITELAATAALALADEPVQVNGRVRDLPNERLVRWYTTIGLVDPPLARRGRTAMYGRRHLLQLVAVKRRQAAGRTIAEIQAELTGATDDTLQRIARIADAPGTATGPVSRASAVAAVSAVPPPPPPAAGTEHRRFWAAGSPPGRDHAVEAGSPYPSSSARAAEPTAPGEPTHDGPTHDGPTHDGPTGDGPTGDQPLDLTPPAEFVVAVRLRPGVTLVLDGARGRPAPAPDQLAAIQTAAGPLLAELDRIGLIEAAGSPGTAGKRTSKAPEPPEAPNTPATANDRRRRPR